MLSASCDISLDKWEGVVFSTSSKILITKLGANVCKQQKCPFLRYYTHYFTLCVHVTENYSVILCVCVCVCVHACMRACVFYHIFSDIAVQSGIKIAIFHKRFAVKGD